MAESSNIYEIFDKSLNRIGLAQQVIDIDPSAIISGSLVGVLGQNIGNINVGKKGFTNDETGYILGLEDGVAKFYIGTPSNYFNFDGTNVTISGSLTASTGSIGGFSIGSDYIRDAVNSFGLASTVSGSDDVRFWAGAAFADRATAPFRVTESGAVVANNLTLTGGTVTQASPDSGVVAKSADTTRAVDQNTYTKLKEFAISVTGSYDVYFELNNADNSLNTYGRIYVNGAAIGTERSAATAAYDTFNETVSVATGDLLQLYGKKDAGKTAPYGNVRNFRLRAVLIPAATVNTD